MQITVIGCDHEDVARSVRGWVYGVVRIIRIEEHLTSFNVEEKLSACAIIFIAVASVVFSLALIKAWEIIIIGLEHC